MEAVECSGCARLPDRHGNPARQRRRECGVSDGGMANVLTPPGAMALTATGYTMEVEALEALLSRIISGTLTICRVEGRRARLSERSGERTA
jgi:hypothetical protein